MNNRPAVIRIWSWPAVALLCFYALMTFAIALIAISASYGTDLISLSISRHAVPIAKMLPGALLWPRFMDIRMTELSIQGPMAILIALLPMVAFSTHRARSIAKRLEADRAAALDETVRERTRQSIRQQNRSHRE